MTPTMLKPKNSQGFNLGDSLLFVRNAIPRALTLKFDPGLKRGNVLADKATERSILLRCGNLPREVHSKKARFHKKKT